MKTRIAWAMVAGCLALTPLSRCLAAEPPVDFHRDIRPILADACYTCHGPDAAKRESALRLDTHDGALIDLGGYRAIVPGSAERSELIKRVTSEDADERMPPPDSGRQLTAAQIELLRRWIDQGAPWREHWAFVAPKRPPLPTVKKRNWPRNGIDRFVLARLEAQRLAPSPEASKESLIRRVTLDLTGLPPSLAEVDAFLADSSAEAYERVVDRLLASPRYGEHMAAEWLDAARYSDTNGYQDDATRTMWPWRDWVIEALNSNMLYSRFTIEQLAGDLLPDATPTQKLATGFHRNHPLNGEGGRIPEESRVEYVVDRVDTTATVWLGLTAGCARCHDHKYDPLAQREFYQLYAFFNNIAEDGNLDRYPQAAPVMSVALPNPRADEIGVEIARLEKELLADARDLAAAEAAWEAGLKSEDLRGARLEPWRMLGPFDTSSADESFSRNFGPEGAAEPKQEYDGRRWQPREFVDGEVTTLDIPPGGALYLARTIVAPREMSLAVSLGSDDGVKLWTNGRELLSRKVSRGAAPDQERVDVPLKPGENRLLLKIHNTGGAAAFYFAAAPSGAPADAIAALKRPRDQRSPAEATAVKRYFRTISPRFEKLNAKISALKQQQMDERRKTDVTTMVMQERAKPRDTYVLVRGQYDQPDKKRRVAADVPSCLPPLSSGVKRDRLALARWLVDPANPLTARVTANRQWQRFFGAGIVKTTEDFGVQGDPPSHPELLDYLATELAGDWDIKAFQRRIVTSAAYRQSSRVTRELLERDPYNRWLTRGPRFRLTAFALRDQALFLGGLLVDKRGGPPVKPYQPAGVWLDFSLGKIDYKQDHGEALYRRSIYTFWRRSVAPTMFFDISDRQVCIVRQSRTNTPLISLTLMNDVTYVEAARAMAERVMKEGPPTSAGRLGLAFRMATARHPTEQELRLLEGTLVRTRQHYQDYPEAAAKFISVGESPRDKRLDPSELAAYAATMSVILNLDEVLTKE